MTGWRIGYAAGPADMIKGLVRIHQYTIMSAPTTAQDAAIEALKSGEPFVQEMLAEYDRRRRLLVDGLNRLGLRTFEPRGAFYAFPNIRASGMDDETFCQKLLEEQHVAVVPGNCLRSGRRGVRARLLRHRIQQDRRSPASAWKSSCRSTGRKQLERIKKSPGRLSRGFSFGTLNLD